MLGSNCENEDFLPGPSAAAPPTVAKGRAWDRELQRQTAAIKAIADARVEHLLTWLDLIQSKFNEEQLKMPGLQFFRENLPNVSLVRGEDGKFDLRWKDENGNFTTHVNGSTDVHGSLLQQLSMAYPSCSDTRLSFGGYQFSANPIKDFSCFNDPQFRMSQGSFNTVMLGMPEGFQTPGAESQRMSIGTTPKTLRLPKKGEMLLSVHGSPLGVYKEENMEVICEAEEGFSSFLRDTLLLMNEEFQWNKEVKSIGNKINISAASQLRTWLLANCASEDGSSVM